MQNKSVQQNNYLYAVKLYNMTMTIQRLCGTYNNTIKIYYTQFINTKKDNNQAWWALIRVTTNMF